MRNTRNTSLSQARFRCSTSWRSDTEPSLLTTNSATTLPFTFWFWAEAGYFRFFVSHFMNSAAPPGNCGRSSTTRMSTGSSYISTTSACSGCSGSSGISMVSGFSGISGAISTSSSTRRSSSLFGCSGVFSCGSIMGISSLSRFSGSSSSSASRSSSASKNDHPLSLLFHSRATKKRASATTSPRRNRCGRLLSKSASRLFFVSIINPAFLRLLTEWFCKGKNKLELRIKN